MHCAYLVVHEQAIVQLEGVMCCVVDEIQKTLESPADQVGKSARCEASKVLVSLISMTISTCLLQNIGIIYDNNNVC